MTGCNKIGQKDESRFDGNFCKEMTWYRKIVKWEERKEFLGLFEAQIMKMLQISYFNQFLPFLFPSK
jgi:hypothetical protein